MTQAASLTTALRRSGTWWTWGELLRLGISNSPWARLCSEGGLARNLRKGEVFERRVRADGMVEMRVVKGKK